MDTTTSVYAEITKSEKLDDGTLLVRGIATSPALDIDQQVCDPAWLSTAMPAWFKWGNIREQHSQIAAGIATEYAEKDGGIHEIVARVVDPSSVKKVETKVLKGFSIGIRGPRISSDKSAPGGRIIGGEIVEVSLVDRPANPECTLTLAKSATPGVEVTADAFDETHQLIRVEELTETTPTAPATGGSGDDTPVEGEGGVGGSSPSPVDPPAGKAAAPSTGTEAGDTYADAIAWRVADLLAKGAHLDLSGVFKPGALGEAVEKRDYSDKERAGMASAGQAMPGGAFPIRTIKDLKNAIQAIGRAKDPAAAKAHIIARAKALGKENLIPIQWRNPNGDADKAADAEVMAHDPAVLLAVRNGLLSLLIAEATEAMAGEREEDDLSCLVDTLTWFLAWWDHESWEGEAPNPSETKAADPRPADQRNAATPSGAAATSTNPTCPQCGQEITANPVSTDGATDPNRDASPASDLPAVPAMPKGAHVHVTTTTAAEAAPTDTAGEAGSKAATSDTVKAAVAEATEDIRKELADTRALLEQVSKAAAPGGPVRTRTTVQETVSAEADMLRVKAARLRAVAKTVAAPDIRLAYERQASDVEAELKALTVKTA